MKKFLLTMVLLLFPLHALAQTSTPTLTQRERRLPRVREPLRERQHQRELLHVPRRSRERRRVLIRMLFLPRHQRHRGQERQRGQGLRLEPRPSRARPHRRELRH